MADSLTINDDTSRTRHILKVTASVSDRTPVILETFHEDKETDMFDFVALNPEQIRNLIAFLESTLVH